MTSTTTAFSFPPLARFRFRFEAIETIRMPAYPGSAWRGLLGQGLRRTACVTRQPTCTSCLLTHSCVYSTLFETPAPAGQAAQGYTAMPHPFVLDIDPKASTQLEPGADFDLVIHLSRILTKRPGHLRVARRWEPARAARARRWHAGLGCDGSGGGAVTRMAARFSPPEGEIVAVRVFAVLVREARDETGLRCSRWELVLPKIEVVKDANYTRRMRVFRHCYSPTIAKFSVNNERI